MPLYLALAPSATAALLAEPETARGLNVTGLATFSDSEPTSLRWGEVVPLSFFTPEALVRARVAKFPQPLRSCAAPASSPARLSVNFIVSCEPDVISDLTDACLSIRWQVYRGGGDAL
jgi:hypothetical protein